MNFWKNLEAPFFSLAPMEDVTDTSFRELVLSHSDCRLLKVLFTEFTSTDGLLDKRGFERVSERLMVSGNERKLLQDFGVKLVAQIWGNDPDKFYKTAKLIEERYHFDGIDINMGCPVKKVVKKNTCSALIREPKLATEIIEATRKGSRLPVSVKTRIGFNKIETEEWIGHLLACNLPALIVHGRTQKMQSDGIANWSEIKKAVELRDKINTDTLIIGNGDVFSYDNGIDRLRQSGADGVMIGRGIFIDPWIFNSNGNDKSPLEKIETLIKHIDLFWNNWGEKKRYNQLKRFYKIYINNFRGAVDLRAKLMQTTNYQEALELLGKAVGDFL